MIDKKLVFVFVFITIFAYINLPGQMNGGFHPPSNSFPRPNTTNPGNPNAVNAPNYTGTSDVGVSKANLDLARFQINDIKARGIIVRLKTDKNRIDAYRKAGNVKLAKKLEERARRTNMVLEYSFITNWSYSPVYFMESQHTSKLIMEDTLIARTYDLQRDTSIYMNHDSFYIVDYGQLISNAYGGAKASNPTSESGAPEPGWFMVVKDHDQNQLQSPMPYSAKVWGDGFAATDKLQPIIVPKDMADSISSYLNTYHDINELLHSDAKKKVSKYMALVYEHISAGYTGAPVQTSGPSTGTIADAATDPKIWGDPYTQAVLRLNKHFIDYYCTRLDKDKNILSQKDPLYWWLRNPNIRYIPHLHDIEVELKKSLDKEETFIKTY